MTSPKPQKVKRVKAWTILDLKSGGLLRHKDEAYDITVFKYPDKFLHKTLKAIPCTITYKLPLQTKQKGK